jgi:signal transduction histidine kinase
MKRPWHIWLSYGLSLVVALAAMAWLTVSTLRVERSEAAARTGGQLDARIRLALWRMDTRLTPLVAQEMARPYTAFVAFSDPPAAKGARPGAVGSPWPLLSQPSEYVLLNFEVGADGSWRSPQVPDPKSWQVAAANGATIAGIQTSAERLDKLRGQLSYRDLIERLPQGTLPTAPLPPDATVALGDDMHEFWQQVQQSGGPAPQQQTANDDLVRRQRALTMNNRQEFAQQRANSAAPEPSVDVAEGTSRAMWIGDQLVLAHRVIAGGQLIVQGCWLDWEKLERDLRAEVADVLPEFEFARVNGSPGVDSTHLLATLPLALTARASAPASREWTPLRVALVLAWAGLALAASAIALLLTGVVALSARREAFVSAVTHELRTPLTTFRMYAGMLEDGMVASESDRKSYLHTLRVEAERLSHLVENVLSYARLERGARAAARERFAVGALLERMQPRLAARAAEADMRLLVQADARALTALLCTDPLAIEQIVFNLVDNACKYAVTAQTRTIELQVVVDGRQLKLRVRDHGPGIAAQDRRRLFRPFSKSAEQAATSAPGVGLGLALCRRLARQLGGGLDYEPSPGGGASFCLALPMDASTR